MINKIALPLLAIGGLAFAVFSVVKGRESPPPSRPLEPPPSSPNFRALAGAGLIEARMENIPIGTTEPGVVTKLLVKVGDKVSEGTSLFTIDDRAAQAELKVREAQRIAAQAELERIQAAPRDGDLDVSRATLDEARARAENDRTELERLTRLRQQNAVTASELDQRRFNYNATRAAVARAEAELDRLARTWKKDIEVSRANVLQAEAQVEAARILIQRLTVRSLADGEVLQVNVRPGQFAALAWKEPLIVLGDVNRLHVRVDIDEQDVPQFRAGSRAIATLKGRSRARFDLQFVKVEPYVIPKKSLTGDNSERVDTRVLQVVYALPDDRPIPLFVGQQMDVYIEKGDVPTSINLEIDPDATRPFENAPSSAPPSTGTPSTTPAT
jgi:multidrug resistance efflux pump